MQEDVLHRARLIKRGLWLEYVTLGWNVVGSVYVLAAAYFGRSVALAGFGIDSVIEIFASVIVVWQLKAVNQDKERLALRLIGTAFLLLGAYIAVQSVLVLVTKAHPHPSPFGIGWLALTLAAMLLLAKGKSVTGVQLGHPVLQSEAKVTLVDAYLAAAVLLGLLLNAVLDWWWADPLAGFVIVFYGVKEGMHDLREGIQEGDSPRTSG